MSYKWCVVPQCINTSIKSPDKVFVSVPKNPNKRKKWLQLARRDPNSISSHTNVFMCEDHFDMEKDTINYMKYKMGFSQKILLADEALPTKFQCQEDRQRRLSDVESSRKVLLKRPRIDLVRECLQSQSATETHAENLQKDYNMLQNIIKPEGMSNLGISIKKEITDETEPTGMSNLSIYIKEEITDETEPTGMSNLGISIKEEITDETDPTVPTIDIKEEERTSIYHGGLVHVKQEGELFVPDDEEEE